MKMRRLILVVPTVLAALAFVPLAQAQATRTWVSGVGDDANPCSRTAPCKTWAGAISKTAKDGEIDALDPGGFGTLTITKSITINGHGTLASILSALSPQAILVNITDPNDTRKSVTIRDLDINGAATGTDGIRFIAGDRLTVEDVSIRNLTGSAVQVVAPGSVTVTGSTFSNTGRGVNVQPTGAASTRVSITRSTVFANSFGITAVGSGVRVTARDVTITGTTSGFGTGAIADSSAKLNLESCLIQNNLVGVDSQGGSTVRVSNSTLTDNVLADHFTVGSQLLSRQNNTVQDNDNNGGFSGTYGPS
jgi:hypothetical protein